MMKRGFAELNSRQTKNLNLEELLLPTGGTALLFLTFLTLVLTLTFLTLNPSISEVSEAHFGGEEVGDFQVHRLSAMPVLVLGTGGRIVQQSHSRQGHRMHPYSRSQHQNLKPDKYDYITDFTEDYFEYEQGKRPISVKGRLKKNFLFWKNVLKANNSILETIHSGYKIPFVTRPPEIMLKNNKSATDNGSFVEEAISDLLKSNCIIECETKP